MKKKYITVKEAAKILEVSPLTLRNWDKKEKLIAYRHPINNYRIYRLDQLEAFLQTIESPHNRKPSTEKPRKIKIRMEDE